MANPEHSIHGLPYRIEDRGHETPCWIYAGQWPVNPTLGYVQSTSGPERGRYVHGLAWTRENGPLAAGLILHHRCEQKTCIRPDHLEPVTRGEHMSIHRKYGPEVVEAIRRATGSTRQIARQFGVSKSHVAFLRRPTR